MRRNFGYMGYDQKPKESPWNPEGVFEVEEGHNWRVDGALEPNIGIIGLELRETTDPSSSRHNPIASSVPFIQNEVYVLHLLEKTATSSGSTTRYWTIDSSSHDDMFQDQTGSVVIDHATGRGTATFRTRFVEWFTTVNIFKLRIRSGSTSGPIIATFDLQPLLPNVILHFFDKDGNLDLSQQALIETQLDEKYTDFRMNIVNVGENPNAGFNGKLKLKVASATFINVTSGLSAASAADLNLPVLPYDKTNATVAATAQTGSGVTAMNIIDFDGINVNNDVTADGTEEFQLVLEAYKDPVSGGTTTIPPINLQILNSASSISAYHTFGGLGFSFKYSKVGSNSPVGLPAGDSSYQKEVNSQGFGPNFIYSGEFFKFSGASQGTGQLSSLYSTYVLEGVEIAIQPNCNQPGQFPNSPSPEGRFYYELAPITTASNGIRGGSGSTAYALSYQGTPPYLTGNQPPHFIGGQDTNVANGHFTINSAGQYSGNPDYDNDRIDTRFFNKEEIQIKIAEDTFIQGSSSAEIGETHEGFCMKIYPENKSPPTLLATSASIMIHSTTNNSDQLTIDGAWATYNPHFLDSTYVDTDGKEDSTSGFDTADFYVPSSLNGQSKRIYIGMKVPFVSGYSNNEQYDFAIGGIQILDLTATNPVKKFMPITANSHRKWQITGTNPFTESPNSDGNFETRNSNETASTTVGTFSVHSYNTSTGGNFTPTFGTIVGNVDNTVARQWNVSMNGGGTPQSNTGMATGIDPDTHSLAPHPRPINAERTVINDEPICEPSVAAASNVGHYFLKSQAFQGIQPSNFVTLRTPKHSFTTGEVIRISYALCAPKENATNGVTNINANDTLFVTVK